MSLNHFGRILAAVGFSVLCRERSRGVVLFTYPRILCGFPPLVSGFLFLLFTPCERPA